MIRVKVKEAGLQMVLRATVKDQGQGQRSGSRSKVGVKVEVKEAALDYRC